MANQNPKKIITDIMKPAAQIEKKEDSSKTDVASSASSPQKRGSSVAVIASKAKQSHYYSGLLRRFAFRNDDILDSRLRGNDKDNRGNVWKKYFFWAALAVIVGGAAYTIIFLLPQADIKITIKKSPWNFNETIAAVKGLTDIDPAHKQIPAEFFSQTRNIVENQPASGKKYVEKYAKGEIILYNAVSSSPQALVKGTRLAAPDGKIFKLAKSVVIPGHSSLRVMVQAERPGADYNISPVDKFTIPGLKNSSKYKGSYGQSDKPMAGGFVGNSVYSSDDDIKNIKQKAEADLRGALGALINSQIPAGYKIVESAQQFNIAKETVGDVDEKGNFPLTIEGSMLVAAFKEEDVLRLMNALAKQSLGDGYEANNYRLDYGAGQIDQSNNKFSFALNYQGTYWQPLDVEKFKKSILGKREIELKTLIFSASNIEKANISFWPFWVASAPANEKRIKVGVE